MPSLLRFLDFSSLLSSSTQPPSTISKRCHIFCHIWIQLPSTIPNHSLFVFTLYFYKGVFSSIRLSVVLSMSSFGLNFRVNKSFYLLSPLIFSMIILMTSWRHLGDIFSFFPFFSFFSFFSFLH